MPEHNVAIALLQKQIDSGHSLDFTNLDLTDNQHEKLVKLINFCAKTGNFPEFTIKQLGEFYPGENKDWHNHSIFLKRKKLIEGQSGSLKITELLIKILADQVNGKEVQESAFKALEGIKQNYDLIEKYLIDKAGGGGTLRIDESLKVEALADLNCSQDYFEDALQELKKSGSILFLESNNEEAAIITFAVAQLEISKKKDVIPDDIPDELVLVEELQKIGQPDPQAPLSDEQLILPAEAEIQPDNITNSSYIHLKSPFMGPVKSIAKEDVPAGALERTISSMLLDLNNSVQDELQRIDTVFRARQESLLARIRKLIADSGEIQRIELEIRAKQDDLLSRAKELQNNSEELERDICDKF